MKYMQILEPTIVVPEQQGKRYLNPLDVSRGTTVGVMRKRKPSVVTGRTDEYYVRWQDAAGRVHMGWLPKTARLARSHTKALRLIPKRGEDRLTSWDTLRYAAMIHRGWTVARWVKEIGDVQVPLLHAVIRELGGKVPRSDDPSVAIRVALKTINPRGTTTMAKNRAVTEEQDETEAPVRKSTKKGIAKKGAVKKGTAKKSAREGGPGRTSMYSGKRIIKLRKDNPRREDTHGYNSWNLLKKGMTYEQYIAAGGRRVDLAWDIEKGNVKLAKA